MKRHQASYSGWTKLVLRPKNYPLSSAASYKAKMRKQMTDAGYTIIFNMGDQYSDLKGDFAEKDFTGVRLAHERFFPFVEKIDSQTAQTIWPRPSPSQASAT